MIGHTWKTRRLTVVALLVPLLFISIGVALSQQGDDAATPAAKWSCDTQGADTMGAGHEGHTGEASMPASDQATGTEFDQLYIDMMLPHHASIIALSEAALPHLTDPWLQDLAQEIIDSQSIENAQLTEWRTAWYGGGEPATDETSMTHMLEAMPVSTMEEMMFQMDPASQVATFCAADDPDRAFLEQMIPHHQMAVDVSVIAIEKGEHPELLAFASRVMQKQQIEIALLAWIQSGWESAATPAA